MKFKLKLIGQTPTHRQFRHLSGKGKAPYPFKADRKLNAYVYELEAETPEELQAEVDALCNNRNNAKLAPVIDREAFHAVTATPRKSIEAYVPPVDIEGAKKNALIDICNELGLATDARNSEGSLREKIRCYLQGQHDLVQRYFGPNDPEAAKDEPVARTDEPESPAEEPETKTEPEA